VGLAQVESANLICVAWRHCNDVSPIVTSAALLLLHPDRTNRVIGLLHNHSQMIRTTNWNNVFRGFLALTRPAGGSQFPKGEQPEECLQTYI
jgi:hypothetical protein